ncbi:hypothetical protein DEU56DRAFT_852034 [Suillus clintonianus]|uniref:uncharacterized protein n=1 Tax=Suillus clintonianus TaxID=1904413 RepID=UPI001B877214|nr:uncharacterized protein DEU56DRAFT_852034 [Suillus clintonianus]KAG2148974.1 hypothetical protein DEU56DRAFT_852034 [Suillus clintonianus]
MSRNRGWRGRGNYSQNQDDRYYGHGGSSYPTYGSSYRQPYGDNYYSNGYYADTQPSQGYNYWRNNDPYYGQNQNQSPIDYNRSREHADDYYHAESFNRGQRRQRSSSPQRHYHSRAQRTDSHAPYIASPSFRRTPDSNPIPAPRMKSPTPHPPPPAEPDPAYMALSLEPSHIVDNPRTSRKLLILDLNGTLLIRSQHSRARPKDAHGSIPTGPAPRLRAVQPRPYIPAFRAYLFAPETQEWLDTMVWSSAQPHSVADMVDKVFGDFKSKLVAVWDRGSLGLTKEDYHRKALTTKDLTKPWTLLPLGTNPAEIAVTSEADCAAEKAGLAPSVAHSAMTTLLLDDSPHKARLQPYNHVCIPEYSSSFREKDIQQFQREKIEAAEQQQMPKLKKRRRKRKTDESVPDQTNLAEILLPSSDSDLSVVGSTSAHVERSSIPIPPAEEARVSSQSSAEPYDPTILAVIGVLDEIKKQSSVAGWIQSGGLWDIVPVLGAKREPIATASASGASIVEDLRLPTDPQEAPLTEKELRVAQRLATKERKRAEQTAPFAAQAVLTTDKEVIQTGNDESTTGDISVEDVPAAAPSAGVESVGMWFNDELTLTYWVWRGRRALDNLGIEADHGVTG